ncbi:hypothetical protein [Promicromonospora soli]
MVGIAFVLFRHRIDDFHAKRIEGKVLKGIQGKLGGRADEPTAKGSSLLLGLGWALLGLLMVIGSFFF